MALIPRTIYDSGSLLDDVFGGSLARAFGGGLGSLAPRPLLVDVRETKDGFELRADAPGVKREQIALEAEGQLLRLNVQQSDRKETTDTDESGTWHRVERSSTFASRALRFPESADLQNVTANLENGVLNVCVKKRNVPEQQRRSQIKIN